jgi:2-polyprenyl-3-methyl-5-hydroxy-6-metoxy-1,4-benzoquinol methylase
VVQPSKSRSDRWAEEAQFFDERAKAQKVAPIPDITLARYRSSDLRSTFTKEFCLRLLGDLRGKRVLDVGCGDGVNSALLAKLGARVVGVDISQGNIDLATERVRVNGVADSVELICSPFESADLPPDAFDVIWGNAVLHHITDELDVVMSRAVTCARPSALLLFTEPMNLFQPLRTFRNWLPVPHDGTPGERPLEPRDLAVIQPYFERMEIRHFGLLGRLDRFILVNFNYEKSAPWRRKLVDAMATIDAGALALPFVSALSAQAVIYGKPAKTRH